jgi:hypothetical protein
MHAAQMEQQRLQHIYMNKSVYFVSHYVNFKDQAASSQHQAFQTRSGSTFSVLVTADMGLGNDVVIAINTSF